MAPRDEIDFKAEDWFNKSLAKLRYGQDYSMCAGHSRSGESSIKIQRSYIRLFSTGVTKLYRINVLGEEISDVEYTDDELKELDKKFEDAEVAHAKSLGDGWE